MVARALTRKGTALAKLAKSSKDYDVAIETFQKALTEHRNPDTLKKLNDAERAKKELEQQEYYDPKIADEEREKGTQQNSVILLLVIFLCHASCNLQMEWLMNDICLLLICRQRIL
jgi:tetratricopeptide (TPR) repeat protein